MNHTQRSVTTLRVSPPNQRSFDVHVYTAKLAEKLLKYPGAVILGETTTPAAGIIPTHVGKTIEQERTEKAAAKERRPPRLSTRKSPLPANPPQPETDPVVIAAAPVYAPHAHVPNTGRPIVNLSTGMYYPSRRYAEQQIEGLGENGIRYWLLQFTPARIKGSWYDWATPEEITARQCLRMVKGEPHTRPPYQATNMVVGHSLDKEVYLHIPTGTLYSSQKSIGKALKLSKARLTGLQPGEIRQTPAGAVRLASKGEIEQWKQKNDK